MAPLIAEKGEIIAMIVFTISSPVKVKLLATDVAATRNSTTEVYLKELSAELNMYPTS